ARNLRHAGTGCSAVSSFLPQRCNRARASSSRRPRSASDASAASTSSTGVLYAGALSAAPELFMCELVSLATAGTTFPLDRQQGPQSQFGAEALWFGRVIVDAAAEA